MVTRVIKYAVHLALFEVLLSPKSMVLATRYISGPLLKELLYKTDKYDYFEVILLFLDISFKFSFIRIRTNRVLSLNMPP